ncbi:hypothetical protein HYH02_000462 [Chlamydomonas schloesseri]|uniref:Protein kinase domain-containing protein n=1 Tax=Chlamydomonas schloesseri TaxID=2026947 RepID=A0A835WXY1_9CHLO|nr:hypothetical protein HYH02_000462 [Chlamydomonas schloesseri]|eukprot:KAG2454621.1 hypothetical protein HYH02_000462 [Chlamydomonas schloesseri]
MLSGSAVVTSASATASLPPPAVLMQQLQQQQQQQQQEQQQQQLQQLHRQPQVGRPGSRRAFLARSTDNSALGLATSSTAEDYCARSSEAFSSSVFSAQSQQLVSHTHGAIGSTASAFGVMGPSYSRGPRGAGGAAAGELGSSLPQLQLPAQLAALGPRAPALSSSTVLPSMPSRHGSQQHSVSGGGMSAHAPVAAAATSGGGLLLQPHGPAAMHPPPQGSSGAPSPVAPAGAAVRSYSCRGSSRLGSVAAITSAALNLLTVVTPGSAAAAAAAGALGSGQGARSGAQPASGGSSSSLTRMPYTSLPPHNGAPTNAVDVFSPAFGASAHLPSAALAAAVAAAAARAMGPPTGTASASLRASGIVLEEAEYVDTGAGAPQQPGRRSSRNTDSGRRPSAAHHRPQAEARLVKGGSAPVTGSEASGLEADVHDVRRLRVGSCWSDVGRAAREAPDAAVVRRGARTSRPCFPAPALQPAAVMPGKWDTGGGGPGACLLPRGNATVLAAASAAAEAATLRGYASSFAAPLLPQIPAEAAVALSASPFASAAACLTIPPPPAEAPAPPPPAFVDCTNGSSPLTALAVARKAAAAADAFLTAHSTATGSRAALSPFAAAASVAQLGSTSTHLLPFSAAVDSDLAFDTLCERADLEITPSFGFGPSDVVGGESMVSQPLQQYGMGRSGQPVPLGAGNEPSVMVADQQQQVLEVQQQQQQPGIPANAADTILRITDLDTCWAELRDLSFLGSGACGNVYTGTWCGMPVAAKFMISGSVDQLQRQQREAALSRLASHPHLVQTYAVATDQLRSSHFRRAQPSGIMDGAGFFYRNSAGADLLGTSINEAALFDTCLTTASRAANVVAGPGGAGSSAAGEAAGSEGAVRTGHAAQQAGGWQDVSDGANEGSSNGRRAGGGGSYKGARGRDKNQDANTAFPAAAGAHKQGGGCAAGCAAGDITSEALSPPQQRKRTPHGSSGLAALRARPKMRPARCEQQLDASGSSASPEMPSPLATSGGGGGGGGNSSRGGRSQQPARRHPPARASQRDLLAYSAAARQAAAAASPSVSPFAHNSAASGFLTVATDEDLGRSWEQRNISQQRLLSGVPTPAAAAAAAPQQSLARAGRNARRHSTDMAAAVMGGGSSSGRAPGSSRGGAAVAATVAVAADASRRFGRMSTPEDSVWAPDPADDDVPPDAQSQRSLQSAYRQPQQSQHRPHLDTIAISTMEDLPPAPRRHEAGGTCIGRRRDSFELQTCASDADGPGALAFHPSDVLAHIGARPGQWLTVVIMEEMDRGSLHRSIHGGLFDATASHLSKRHRVRGMVRTLVEVAQGMAALHASGLVHGDLKPANVLLKAQTRDARGFVAKVSDLGCTRVMVEGVPASTVTTNDWGTVIYTAPEVFNGRSGPPSDVYSFGALTWHLTTGQLPHEDLNPFAVLLAVSKGDLELEWPRSVPKPLRRLGQLCMQHDPAARPTFAVIARALLKLEQRMKTQSAGARLAGLTDRSRQASTLHPSPDSSAVAGHDQKGCLPSARVIE